VKDAVHRKITKNLMAKIKLKKNDLHMMKIKSGTCKINLPGENYHIITLANYYKPFFANSVGETPNWSMKLRVK